MLTYKEFIPLQSSDLVIGQRYNTPSGMGGAFTVQYKGTNPEGKHVFQATNPGWTKWGCAISSKDIPRKVCTLRYTTYTMQAYWTRQDIAKTGQSW